MKILLVLPSKVFQTRFLMLNSTNNLICSLYYILSSIFGVISAQNKSENSNKTGTRQLGNQVIRKGHMVIQNLGIMKGLYSYHFILKA